jgi:plastocyanin
VTRRPERTNRALKIVGLVVGVIALVVGMAACGDTGDSPTTQELVVPRGTAEKLADGEAVTVMPTEMQFEVGDTLRIRNEDVEPQAVGPYRVAAGDEFEITFGSPGRFEGVCALAEGERYEIVITG